MKLWGGRFDKDTDQRMEDFHSSIHFDQRLAEVDIRGSMAHARMLGQTGIIAKEEADALVAGLEGILHDLKAGQIEFDPAAEDIHMNVEKILTERVGDVGKKLHTARSRNDQVALDFRLYTLGKSEAVNQALKELQGVLVQLAEAHTETLMPGYTHLQRAQPVTLAHHLMAYFEMFRRDRERLQDGLKRTAVSPLGSGAIAGTSFPIDRQMVAADLGVPSVTRNSMDGVSDRDFALEFVFDLSVVMIHLSRFCEEIILWSSTEFGFVDLDDAYATGSSMMPQKKNPDAAELIRGKSGRVFGDLMGLLTMMKGLPLTYNKDMQEDKEALFDAVDTVLGCLSVFTPMLQTAKFRKTKMADATADGFLNATDLADYLAANGVPFRKAHEISGKAVHYALEKGKRLDDLTLTEYRQWTDAPLDGLMESIRMAVCLARRKVVGGPAPVAVKLAIEEAKRYL
ncbi:MAG TPA: argininosuccinate lyase, partial [Bacillota bacterium]|nr:argininosuccinate lyase [Bacillota bacterium]